MYKYIILALIVFLLAVAGYSYYLAGDPNYGIEKGTGVSGGEEDVGALLRVLREFQGGTGTSTYATGNILYSDATDSLAQLVRGSNGQVLKLSGGIPAWGTDNSGDAGTGSNWEFTIAADAIRPTTTVGIILTASSTFNADLTVTGTAVFDSNVGIGSSTPDATLSVVNTGTGQSFVVEDTTSPDSTPFVIDANGNVGIGTAAPARRLHVDSGTLDVGIRLESSDSLAKIEIIDSGGTKWLAAKEGQFHFNASDPGGTVGDLIIDSNGNIGLGTTSPYAKLSVVGEVVMETFNATSTTASSTIAGGLTVDRLDIQSTTATSTFANGLRIEAGGLRSDNLISCDTIDTTSTGVFVCGSDTGAGGDPNVILVVEGGTTYLQASTTVNAWSFDDGFVSQASSTVVGNLTLGTGGAGDSRIQQGADGIAWSLGLDDSDSDAFVISSSTTLGTNNAFRLDKDLIGFFPTGHVSQASSTINGALTITGLALLEGGLTLQDGDTFTFSGDAFTDFTGDATISLASGALQVVDLNCTNCIGETEISDVYLVNNANDATTGNLTVGNASGEGVHIGTTGVFITSDQDGALTFTGESAGFDEDLRWNFDDTSNEIVIDSTTGVATTTYTSIGASFDTLNVASTNATSTFGNGIRLINGAIRLSGDICAGKSNGGALVTDSTGLIVCEGDDSAAGGTLEWGQAWEVKAEGGTNYLAPTTTTYAVLADSGFLAQASSTIDSTLRVTSTTTLGDGASGDVGFVFDGDTGNDGEIRWDVGDDEFDISNSVHIETTGTPLTIHNTNDGVDNEVLHLRGNTRATAQDDDAAHIELELTDSAGNEQEFVRLTWQAVDVTNGSEDGNLHFEVMHDGSFIDALELHTTVSAQDTTIWNTGSENIDFTIKGDTDGNLFRLDASTDRIGIGTTTPGQKLSVAGDILGNAIIGSFFIGTTTATSTLNGSLQATVLDIQSTTATSTFANGLKIEAGALRVTNLESCDTIDTDAFGVLNCGIDGGGGGDFAWTIEAGGESSTSTELWFGAGFVSQASSTVDGTLTITGLVSLDAGLTMAANQNITLGAQTLDHDGTDFVFNDTINATDLVINSLNFTFADAAADAVFGWDDTASNYENLTAAEVLTIVGGAANDFDGSGDVTIAIADISDLGSGVGTWLATPSSANLITATTDETGSGVLVFDTAPTFTTSIIVTGGCTIDADGIDCVTGNDYEINGTQVLDATTLGSAVVNSSLTNLGELTALNLNGNLDLIATGNRIDFDTDNDTSIRASADDTLVFEQLGVDRTIFGLSNYRFNDTSLDMDFIIDGNNTVDLFFLNAGTDSVGIASTTPTGDFAVGAQNVQATSTFGGPVFVDDPTLAATGTVYLTGVDAFGGSIIMKNPDGTTCVEVSLNDTNTDFVFLVITCPTFQAD